MEMHCSILKVFESLRKRVSAEHRFGSEQRLLTDQAVNNQGDLGTRLRNVSNKQEILVQVGKTGPLKSRSFQIFTEAIKSLKKK